MNFLERLAARRRFGMKPGLDTIRALSRALGDPQKSFKSIHIAGTNGKGAVAAILDASLRAAGLSTGRYTSPHLVRLNERFFLDGEPAGDDVLEVASSNVERAVASLGAAAGETTFFEALTAVAFAVYAARGVDAVVLETGLGGRLDATNIADTAVSVITRIGLDHCDYLGSSIAEIASEKAGIIKPGIPVVLGANLPEVRAVIEKRAAELGSPFYYAPEIASDASVPAGFALKGSFNRENAVTALAVLKVILERSIFALPHPGNIYDGFSRVVWPGRFQKVGNVIIDGAHNPPAANALAAALAETPGRKYVLVAGFCADKDVGETISILAPFVKRAYAVKTNNPRSLEPAELASMMAAAGIDAEPAADLATALRLAGADPKSSAPDPAVLVCGSLFLAGEALVALGAYPWPSNRFDPSEKF